MSSERIPLATPRPGSPVRGSRSGRPIMAALDLLGRRWALRVLWELREGPQSFRALRARCDEVSPSVLNQRLAELRASGIVAHEPGSGYALRPEGESLLAALAPLHDWAARWARAQGARPPRAPRR
ncbi:MAG TPA: helix-turn-helix domain-containing protein [Myxococcota bacterium]|nr:helix-turn-helix domain-containing protein [Myxococcota bacterium]